MTFGEQLLDRLHFVDAAMVAAGSYPIPGRWWQALERFYLSDPPKLALCIRKGRQVYFSKGVLPRVAGATLLVERYVPPGEIRSVACLSVKRSEAADRLLNIQGVLDVLRIPYSPAGETLNIPDLRARITVMTASYKTSVGDTCDLVFADELCRWQDDTSSSNPASRVIGSVTPVLVQLPNAKLFLVSSPWVDGDYHSKRIDAGDTVLQNVETFATWEVMPHLTEQMCRNMCQDESEFNREYGAIPDDGATVPYLDPASIDAAFSPNAHLDSELHPDAYRHLHQQYRILH